MKFMFWSLGVLQILTGFVLAWTIAPAWKWVWITCAIYWIFVGVIAAGIAMAKLVAGKVGAGGVRRLVTSAGATPAPKKED